MSDEERDPQKFAERIEELSARIAASSDPLARDAADELVSSIMEIHGEGLERILMLIGEAGPDAQSLRTAVMDDGIVGSLLLIHGLYPVDLESRVHEALDGVRPYLHSHGGDVELVSLEGDVAKLRLQGSCEGCPGSIATLEQAIRTALEETAPDLVGVEVEGLGALPTGPKPVWHRLDAADELDSGAVASAMVSGTSLVVVNVGGTLLAYRNECPECQVPLTDGTLEGGILTCSGCKRRYVLPADGRAIDGNGLHLDAVGLEEDAEGVRVALTA